MEKRTKNEGPTMKVKLTDNLLDYNCVILAKEGEVIEIEEAVANPYNINYHTVDGHHPVDDIFEDINNHK